MKKLDIYLSTHFLQILFFILIAVSFFFIIIDMVEFLDKFIDENVSRSIIFKYYLYYLPYIFELVTPMAVLLASLISIGQKARFNELAAMQTSGISLYRIAFPILVIGFLVSVLMIGFAEYVVAPANQKKFEIKREYLDKVPRQISTKQNNITFLQNENELTNIEYFDSEENIAYKVTVYQYDSGKLLSRIDAKQMIWKNDNWVLKDGISRMFQSNEEIVEPFSEKRLDDFPVLLTDLKKAQKQPDEMNFRELQKFIEQIIINGADPQKWYVDLYLKIAFPFSNLVIVIFGIPLASIRRRGGTALGFGLGLVIIFVYYGLIRTFQAIGHNGIIDPIVAAWGGNVIFGVLGIFLMIKAKK